jgi:hypothetical protein
MLTSVIAHLAIVGCDCSAGSCRGSVRGSSRGLARGASARRRGVAVGAVAGRRCRPYRAVVAADRCRPGRCRQFSPVARSPSFVARAERDSSQQSRRPTVEAGPSPFRRARAAPAHANRRGQRGRGRGDRVASHSTHSTTRAGGGAGRYGSVTSSPSMCTRPAVGCCSMRPCDSPAPTSRSNTVGTSVARRSPVIMHRQTDSTGRISEAPCHRSVPTA